LEDGQHEPIEVPYLELSSTALRGVIESVILREGTDYGTVELTLEEKVARVMHQLGRREARIMFDPRTESVHIVPTPAPGSAAADTP
jgi:uncharacterized protein YheU (UPF0270 family)